MAHDVVVTLPVRRQTLTLGAASNARTASRLTFAADENFPRLMPPLLRIIAADSRRSRHERWPNWYSQARRDRPADAPPVPRREGDHATPANRRTLSGR